MSSTLSQLFRKNPVEEVKPPQFAKLLRSQSAFGDYKTAPERVEPGKKPSVSHSPDKVLRAYADLLSQVLIYQRAMTGSKQANNQELRDLADAMHNIGHIFVDYGMVMDDEKYRTLYLRRFDHQWAVKGFGLEQFLESRLSVYSKQ